MRRPTLPSRWRHSVEGLAATLTQYRYAVQLLLDRRLLLFLVADLMVLFVTFLDILSEGGKPKDIFIQVVAVPVFVLGLPALGSVLALERRAGSLDLALAVPSTERYFLRRVTPICALLALQGAVVLLLTLEHRGDLLRSLAQTLLVTTFLGVLVLFWAVRLPSSGAVLAASAISLLLASRWLFYDPTLDRTGPRAVSFLGVPVPLLEWWWNALVLAFAIVILFAYARLRLRRPETLLT